MDQGQRHDGRAGWRRVRRRADVAAVLSLWAGCIAAAVPILFLRGILGDALAASLTILIVLATAVAVLWWSLRVAQRVDRAGDHLCPYCRYDLSGLGAAGVCPECGAEFNLPELCRAWSKIVPPWHRALARRILGP